MDSDLVDYLVSVFSCEGSPIRDIIVSGPHPYQWIEFEVDGLPGVTYRIDRIDE